MLFYLCSVVGCFALCCANCAQPLLGSLRITNINGNINTSVKNLFKISAALLVLNKFFTFLLMFPFMFVIHKLPIVH